MEYPPTPSRGLTASPESMEKSQQFGLGFDSDATPKPLRIGKRNASAAATPTPARNSIPRKPLPLRQASADVQSPLYARNTAIAPIHIPVRQSSTTFAQKLYGEGPSVIMGDAPTKETQGRVRSDSIASNSSRALSSLRDEEILAIKKHRHQRTISDTSSISTNAIRGIAQAEFRAENPPLNSGTTFYGPQRFDTDTGNASGDDEHPFYQKVQHRAASPGFDLDTENNSPVSPPIEWPLRTSSKEYAPVAPATSTTTDPFVDSQEVEFTRKNRFTRENRSKSLGNPEKVNPAPQSTSLKIKDKVLAMFHGRSVSISSTHSDRSDLTVRSTQSTRTKGKYKARQSQALQGFKLTQHVQEDAESVASSALSVRSELSSRSENSMATTTVDENGEPYRMSLPENAQLLGLELRIIPEVDCINPDTGRTIWIAVEAEARVRRRAILNAPNYGKGSIDAAIIIDET